MSKLLLNRVHLTVQEITESFTSKPEIFICGNIFDQKKLSSDVPYALTLLSQLSKKRLSFLYENNLSVISFELKSTIDFLNEHTGNPFIDYKYKVLEQIRRFPNLGIEMPRSGIFIMSKEIVPKSLHVDFFEQTRLLLDYCVFLFPEIRSTSFYRDALLGINNSEMTIRKLFSSKDYERSINLLNQLEVNKLFRPSFSEITQLLFLYQKFFKKNIYNLGFCWVNSANINKEKMVIVNALKEEFILGESFPDVSRYKSMGSPIIISLEWLLEILRVL